MSGYMTAQNYDIQKEVELGAGSRAFFWSDVDGDYHRVGDAMPAVFDFREDGINYRIEILYVQGELKDLNRTLVAREATADSKLIFQVGVENPVSFVLRVDALSKKSYSHTAGDAWLLEDSNAQIVGVETLLPQ